ncbi:MAG: acetoacetate--CoA ligase [Phenylobacterium sp.]|uniref:acetoacetate--CoA ligase n=1 Tax=Phenylobacterium sp. TaxID=1871053 RepID=UPI0025E65479|nr:acetoacetate--CoA ligase [Phenylobacterium sp.]MBI1199281.1 acetoacetate--CoA ligase [Phenylobacterium sp.]
MSRPQARAPLTRLQAYRAWLRREAGLDFADYAELWSWSTTDLAAFWDSIWAYFELESPTPHRQVLDGEMPEAVWFEGAQVNYALQVLRHAERADAAGQPAIVAENEDGAVQDLSWRELRRRTASLALELRAAGVGRGDRVAAYLPNIPDAAIGLLACASIGAIWTLCSPDMGTPAVLDRFRQVEPKALLAIDGVRYGGKGHDRSRTVEDIRRGLPSLAASFVLRSGWGARDVADAIDLGAAQSRDDPDVSDFEPEWLPFGHPLWILYSSGTTGLPKAIVHGHGGVILASCAGALHMDLGPSYSPDTLGERFHWYSATGWVMWNVQVGGLLTGTTICLFDGSPRGGLAQPDWGVLWAFAARRRITWFGAGAAFYVSCRKAGLELAGAGDLSAVRALGSTGSPLPAEVQAWGSDQFRGLGTPDIWWCNLSGGTDIAAAFLSGNRDLPATPGRIQCRHLGAAVQAWDEAGHPLTGAVGELVCTRPFPSMPLFLWGDADGARYRATYFETWPSVWRHGDWLTIQADGGCIISGRSDATINRHGLRMGTAEIYAAVEDLPDIVDSLVIDVGDGEGDSKLIMFVAPKAGRTLDDTLVQAIGGAIRDALSPRFVPDVVLAAPAIPRTLSGKKQELPIKRLFQGWPAAKVLDPNLMQHPEAIDWYVEAAVAWRRGGEISAPGSRPGRQVAGRRP